MNRQTPVALPEGYVEFYSNLENWQNEQEIVLRKTILRSILKSASSWPTVKNI
jgi:hypothetical protein